MRFATLLAVAFTVSSFALAPAARAADPSSSDDSAPFTGKPPAPSAFAPMAASGAPFGGTGQWVVTVQSTSFDGGTSVYVHKGWSLNLQPALDYFLSSNLSIGGVVGFNYNSSGVTTVGLGARVGFNLKIVDQLGFWPTAGIFTSYLTGNHMSNGQASVGIFAPFLYHPVPHLFLGLGPSFGVGLTDGNGTDWGIDFVIGGWI